ncbi:MAG: FAD/NAD(P)-binding protein [Desulfobacterales bacterium]|nr:MAG: FAD/NAD(P)-binding protein [Desulfobacterales bacterium]
MEFKFGIIGGGLTGTSMLCQFVQRLQQQKGRDRLQFSKIEIRIFEKQEVFGPGLPHNDRYVMPYHITNMCARDMGILAGNPADFQQWVENNRNILQDKFPHFDGAVSPSNSMRDQCNHYPRAVMGEYLKARFQEAVHIARDLGLKVKLHPGTEITRLLAMGDKVHLGGKDLISGKRITYDADRVLLATGHWFEESRRGNYFTSPWPAKSLLENIPPGATVGVIGTSLSAIETVLTLTSDGKFVRKASKDLLYIPSNRPRQIALYSRRGMLPKVRGRIGKYRNRIFTLEKIQRLLLKNDGFITLKQIFQLLDSELAAAYGRPFDWDAILNPTGTHAELLQQYMSDAEVGDGPDGELIWQSVFYQTFPLVRELYLCLTMEERKLFDREYSTLFFMHAATQPHINAEKLLALIKFGSVRVHRLGANYRFYKDDHKNCYVFKYEANEGQPRQDTFQYVVDARGQPRSLATNPSELAKNMLNSGTYQIEEFQHTDPAANSNKSAASRRNSGDVSYETGSIRIDPATHRVMRKGPDGGAATPSHPIYAVGAMTRGQIIDASMAHGIALSTAQIAGDLVDHLTQ